MLIEHALFCNEHDETFKKWDIVRKIGVIVRKLIHHDSFLEVVGNMCGILHHEQFFDRLILPNKL